MTFKKLQKINTVLLQQILGCANDVQDIVKILLSDALNMITFL